MLSQYSTTRNFLFIVRIFSIGGIAIVSN
ncbi:hypothetical protein ACFW04_010467 [Cataglyphis niger]